MTTFETIGPASANTLATLWVDTFRQAYKGVHTPDNIQAYCADNFTRAQAHAELCNPKTECVVALKGDKPVGFTFVKHQTCPSNLEGTSSELKQIYILADQYGTGLGKTLYQAVITSLQAQKRDWVWLYVSDINHRAKSFYDKLGFVPMGTGPVFKVGTDRLPSTILAKRLKL